MSIANVLVHIGGNTRPLQGFEVAAALARIHRAHLTGLDILPRTDLPGVAHIYVGPDVIERQHTIANRTPARPRPPSACAPKARR